MHPEQDVAIATDIMRTRRRPIKLFRPKYRGRNRSTLAPSPRSTGKTVIVPRSIGSPLSPYDAPLNPPLSSSPLLSRQEFSETHKTCDEKEKANRKNDRKLFPDHR